MDRALLLGLLVAVSAALFLRRTVGARAKVRSLATKIERMRSLADQQATYRPATAEDAGKHPGGDELDHASRDLAGCGIAVLGDYLEVQRDGTESGITRWFASADGSTCGWVGLAGTVLPPRPVMSLFAETATGEFAVTVRGGGGVALQQPPFVRRRVVSWDQPLAQTLAAHRATFGTEALVPAKTAEDGMALLARLKAHIAEWRAMQPADTLLDQDLRNVLGARYAELAPKLMPFLPRGAR